MALTSGNLGFERRSGKSSIVMMAASAVVFVGGLAVLTAAGYARAGRVSTTDKAIGVFKENATGGASDGAVSVEVENDGWYKFKNSSAGDLITIADIESPCYIVDDETVAKTHATNTRVKAGIVKAVEAGGVWVHVGANA